LANSENASSPKSGQDHALEAPLSSGVAFASYADLPATCLRFAGGCRRRRRLARAGFDFSAHCPGSDAERALDT